MARFFAQNPRPRSKLFFPMEAVHSKKHLMSLRFAYCVHVSDDVIVSTKRYMEMGHGCLTLAWKKAYSIICLIKCSQYVFRIVKIFLVLSRY